MRGEMGITSGLYSPRAAPRGPEVTGEPSAVSSRLRAQLPGPGPSAPAPSAPGPPSRGHLRGHPFPLPSSSLELGELERRQGCYSSQSESGPEDRQPLNRPGMRWSPLKARPCLSRHWEGAGRLRELLNLCRPQTLTWPEGLKCPRAAPSHLPALQRRSADGIYQSI